jgi:hypothetical protein
MLVYNASSDELFQTASLGFMEQYRRRKRGLDLIK